MLYYFLFPLSEYFSVFNVFKYITFRSFGAVLTGVLFALLVGPKLIAWLKRAQIGQVVRDDGPQSHLSKKGTPTMGGVLILSTIIFSGLLWGDLSNPNTWILLATSLFFAWIGWIDDYQKIKKKNTKGLTPKQKLLLQFVGAFVISTLIYKFNPTVFEVGLGVVSNSHVFFPLFKQLTFDLGLGIIALNALVIVGTSNAVNLTDGLDGLAAGPTISVAATLGLLLYLCGNIVVARYLQIPFVPLAGEAAVIAAAVLAGTIGFLWFNTYPAQVFMGDVGSLSLGAVLGTLAVISQNQILLVFLGGVFVVEALSVILQVAWYKRTKKRIFKMAPIHHHFELKGWPEPRVIVRFWIVSFLLAIISLATLKLR